MGFKDECGVAGIFGAENAASLSYFALTSLQHRGQESAGIAVCDNEDGENKIRLRKDMGLVGDIFKPSDFKKLKGHIAVSHVRYATAGGRTLENAQPFLNSFKNGSIALAHNGQLVNHSELRELLENYGCTFASSSDSEVILKLIVRKFIEKGGKPGSGKKRTSAENQGFSPDDELFVSAVKQAVREIKGSFSLCIMTENMLIGVRDPNGIRPLCLGSIGGEGRLPLAPADAGAPSSATPSTGRPRNAPAFILASESCAIDAVNGKFLRDIEPGEIVVITKNGMKSIRYAEEKKKTCIFEYVYFARPDSIIDGIPVQEARYKMGEELARESAVEADVVIGVPDSGIGAALGYARESKIPYVTGIIKNKYIGLTWWFWRIKHHSNGSEVTIEGLPEHNTFKIIRDGRQIKTGAILTKKQKDESERNK